MFYMDACIATPKAPFMQNLVCKYECKVGKKKKKKKEEKKALCDGNQQK